MKALILITLVWFALNCFAQQDTLVWSDEFEETGLPNSANWTYDLGTGGWGNNEIQNYTNKTQNVRQENGVLIIEALKSGNSWTSARIITKNRYDFTYGRIVYRAKLPIGRGTWPALWMLGKNISSVGWPACGEIDVMEHVGKNPGVVQSALHTPSSNGNTINKGSKSISGFNTEFHLYEANWKSDRIEFRYDNTLVYTYKPSVLNSSTWPFSKPFFIIMNIAMGGNWGSDPQYETNGLKNGIDPALTSARMEIDYVRVYKPLSFTSINELPGEKDQTNDNGIVIFPNPTEGVFHVKLPEGTTSKGTVSDSAGKVVLIFEAKSDTTNIDLSDFPKGMYYVSLQTEGKVVTRMIILK